LNSPPLSLSTADLSLIRLALEYKLPIATDDRSLRLFAKNLEISVIGSLGLLKTLYKKKIIKTKEEYISLLESLQKDIFISDDLMKWALE
jgi:predicted nucleic acid-binding protein